MGAWFSSNWIDVALIAGVALVAALAVWVMIRSRKAGKAPCGCSCSGCGGACASCPMGCHAAGKK